jgi:hypothetical protein
MNMIDSTTLFEIIIKSQHEPLLEYLEYLEYKHELYGIIQLSGRLDAITKESVWEFKCVDEISLEHKLQLIVYFWMWNFANMSYKYGIKDFSILNIKSGQILQLYTKKILIINQIIEILFDNKYLDKKILNDEEFIKMCLE